jgi:hypothetical protein
MRKYIYILYFLFASFSSNAQIATLNLAVKKPRVSDVYNFVFTGGLQKFIVPNRVTSIQVKAIGAKGGTGARGQIGGAGANITTTLNVTPGQVLYIVVGGFPGQSTTAKYGFGGSGGSGTNYGGAGGGLSGVFSNSSPSNASALIIAGGGGGGAGVSTGSDYTGGNAGNNAIGSSNNGNEPTASQNAYIKNDRYQYGYAASTSAPGQGGEPYDVVAGTSPGNGSDISGGNGGTDAWIGTWNGGGGGGAGYYGGGGGAGGGAATGGGAGGATKSNSGFSSFGTPNTTGDGSVTIICFTNSGVLLNLDAGNTNSYGGTGTTWTDLSGNGLNGTLTNATHSSNNSGYFAFNGSNSSVQIANTTQLTNKATFSAWVYPNKFANSGNNNDAIITKHDQNSNNGFCLIFNNAGFSYSVKPSSNAGAVANTYSSPINQWYYVTITMDQSNVLFYLNGSLIQTNSVTTGWSFSNNVFYLGYSPDNFWGRFSGNIGSVMVYNRVLTATEITNNFNTQKLRYGL